MQRFTSFLEKTKHSVEKVLSDVLPMPDVGESREQTFAAMRYSVFIGGGGKRIRPALVLGAWELCQKLSAENGPREVWDCAVGIELIHTYTLVVDDIEDKSDMRRGEPSCHIKFGLDTTVFAAGMLYERGLRPFHRLPIYRIPGTSDECTGYFMDGVHRGQTSDMNSLKWPENLRTLENLQFIHAGKTSALIQLALLGGALCAGASETQKQALVSYGYYVGLAFQARDDVLSIVGDPKILGKPTGPEADAGKLTYVSLFGSAESAQQQAEQLSVKAIEALKGAFDSEALILEELALYAVRREK